MSRTSFYVDDCITGAGTLEEALCLQQSLSDAQMMLRKWRSKLSQFLVCANHALCQIPHWLMGRGWDEPTLPDIQERFDVLRNKLPCLKERPMPRQLVQYESPVLSRQLHSFSDASQAGYGAIIYVRNLHSDDSIFMVIVVAKAKVTPKKMVADSRSCLSHALSFWLLTFSLS